MLIGCDVRLKVVVGDSVDELAQVLTAALESADLTSSAPADSARPEDDITQRRSDARSGCSSRSTTPSSITSGARFARRAMTMPDINRRQAMVPRGATVLANPNGTAPGLWIERGRCASSCCRARRAR